MIAGTSKRITLTATRTSPVWADEECAGINKFAEKMNFKVKIVFQPIGDFYLLVPVVQDATSYPNYIRLNATCYFIAKCIQDGLPEQQIVEKFASEFGISTELASRDVQLTIDGFRQIGVM